MQQRTGVIFAISRSIVNCSDTRRENNNSGKREPHPRGLWNVLPVEVLLCVRELT